MSIPTIAAAPTPLAGPEERPPQDRIPYGYDTVSRWDHDAHPYGVPAMRGCAVHREGAVYVVARQGRKVAEIHPDGVVYLVIAAGEVSSGVKTAWQIMLGLSAIETIKRRSVTGRHRYEFEFVASKATGERDRWGMPTRRSREIGRLQASERIRVDTRVTPMRFEAADPPVVIERDGERYRAFNRALRKLRVVLSAQIKMGAYDAMLARPESEQLSRVVELLGAQGFEPRYGFVHYIDRLGALERLYRLVTDWARDQVPDRLEAAMLLAIRGRSSEARRSDTLRREDARRRMLAGLREVQETFLRRECLTISQSENCLTPSDESDDSEDSDDPNGQLLAPAGLRAVQAPRAAEVC